MAGLWWGRVLSAVVLCLLGLFAASILFGEKPYAWALVCAALALVPLVLIWLERWLRSRVQRWRFVTEDGWSGQAELRSGRLFVASGCGPDADEFTEFAPLPAGAATLRADDVLALSDRGAGDLGEISGAWLADDEGEFAAEAYATFAALLGLTGRGRIALFRGTSRVPCWRRDGDAEPRIVADERKWLALAMRDGDESNEGELERALLGSLRRRPDAQRAGPMGYRESGVVMVRAQDVLADALVTASLPKRVREKTDPDVGPMANVMNEVSVELPGLSALVWKTNVSVFADPPVRQALTLARTGPSR